MSNALLEVINAEKQYGYVNENNVVMLNAEFVARGLGFTQTAASGNEVVRWERVNRYLREFGFIPTCGDDVKAWDYIPENMFYRLAMKAKNAAAREFQAKVADEILPSIRKNGVYMTVQAAEKILYNPDFIIGLAKQVKEAQAKIAELEPKADYFDEVLESTSTLLTTTIAKAYGMSGKAFNKLLAECEIQYYCGGCWHLKQPYAKLGYVEYETLKIGHITRQQMKWTEKGRYFLYSSLKKKGILPIREREEVMTELWGA